MTGTRVPFRRATVWIGLICGSLLICGASSSPAAAKSPHPQKKPDYKRQVEQLEELWRIAQLNDDVAQMDRLLSDDYVGITLNGQVVTKAQQLERTRTRQLVLTNIQLNDLKIKLIGSTAVVTSEANVDGSNEGTPIHGTYRYTRVYTRVPGAGWKITNFEATRVGPQRDRHESERAQGPASR
jgi:ketosteroid isomerase-like protein